MRLASHVNFRQFVTENGIDFYPLKGIFLSVFTFYLFFPRFLIEYFHLGNPEQLMNFMVNHPNMITLSPKEIAHHQQTMQDIYVWAPFSIYFSFRLILLILFVVFYMGCMH